MLVTINTDASLHPEHKVGAFAFWSVSNEFKIKKGGFFRDICKNSHDAEMKCIINAVSVTLADSEKITKVIINTDSMNSIHVFNNDRKNISLYNLHWAKGLAKKFRQIKKKKDWITFEFRHVKAHSGVNDKRSYVNEWCDTTAKYWMWRRLNELKAQGHFVDK